MCIACFEQGIKGAVAVGDKAHCLASRTPSGQDILKEKVSCEAVNDNGNCFGAEVISESVPVHVIDPPALKSDDGSSIVYNMLKWDCPACTGVLPSAENQDCQQCYHGVHI